MRHLIVFCHLRWDFVQQRPQHLLTRLARHWPVHLVEEPMRGDGAPRLERTTPARGIEVLRPQLPDGGRGFADDQFAVLKDLLHDHLREHGIDDYVVWFYTPMALPMLNGLNPKAVVYDCMDELSSFKHAPPQLREREAALLEVADLVFTGGPSLYEAKRDLHPQVFCLPSAVDAQHFSRERALSDIDAMRCAGELQCAIAQPRLGFFGVVDERLDLDLVDGVAAADPSWQLVMVGPVAKISADSLPRRPNIHWLGQQSYALLPQLVAGWDVCLLPFALNEATRFISPTKTLEYMAAEKPVVSTPVRDVALLYGRDVRIAGNVAAFVAACRDMLAESPEDRLARIRQMLATVARYSWDNTAQTMRSAIEQVIDARSTPEFRAATSS
ncbi:MAG TPA: glycosyltransferase [Albitalea sp.]|nr:glycosyltransferase [Albitalea sp.]